MKLINGIYETDNKTKILFWVSYERGVKAGEVRVIDEKLCYADSIISGDRWFNKPRILWLEVKQTMIP